MEIGAYDVTIVHLSVYLCVPPNKLLPINSYM
jgi:hypothetical protein